MVDLKGVHPDDAFSTVPYEKGSLFLRFLEDSVGGPGEDFVGCFFGVLHDLILYYIMCP